MGMNTLIHADIFFFITSIAVVLLTVVLLIVGYYAVGIARDIRFIVARVREGVTDLEKDFEALRTQAKFEGARVRMLVDLVLGFFEKKFRSRPKQKREKGPLGE